MGLQLVGARIGEIVEENLPGGTGRVGGQAVAVGAAASGIEATKLRARADSIPDDADLLVLGRQSARRVPWRLAALFALGGIWAAGYYR